MRSLMVASVFLFLAAGAVQAEPAQPRVFEDEYIIGSGGALILAVSESWEEHHTALLTGFLAGRLRAPNYSPLGLEASLVAPHGLGTSFFIDILNFQKARTRVLFNTGIFLNVVAPVSVMNINRLLDVTMGFGAEIQINNETRLTADWRAFLPWPWDTISRYGDFARPFYEEAFKGGQLWIGVARGW